MKEENILFVSLIAAESGKIDINILCESKFIDILVPPFTHLGTLLKLLYLSLYMLIFNLIVYMSVRFVRLGGFLGIT